MFRDDLFRAAGGSKRPLVIARLCSQRPKEALAAAQAARAAGAEMLRVPSFLAGLTAGSEALQEGQAFLAEARAVAGLPLVLEVAHAADVPLAAQQAGVLQVGGAAMANASLLRALGQVKKPVLLQRAPGASVEEWLQAAGHILAGGNRRVILCEAGGAGGGAGHTLDLGAALAARARSRLPVIAEPGCGPDCQGLLAPLVRAALAAGLDGVAIPVRPDGPPAEGAVAGALSCSEFHQLMAELGLAPPPADLGQCRSLIDRIDQELLTLLSRRMAVALRIGEVKAAIGLPVYQPEREEALLEHLTACAAGALPRETVRAIWCAIMAESRRLQADHLGRLADVASAREPGGLRQPS